jgi:hypothetical protein
LSGLGLEMTVPSERVASALTPGSKPITRPRPVVKGTTCSYSTWTETY